MSPGVRARRVVGAPMTEPLLCDGCGRAADAAHISRRIARLEMATQFRPIHISILFVTPSPPVPLDEFFYSIKEIGTRPDSWSLFTSEFFPALGIAGDNKAARLTEFQRLGCFLTHVSECPCQEDDPLGICLPLDEIVRRTPVFLQRVVLSYKPRHLVLLSVELAPLGESLRAAGWGERVLMHNRRPVALPGSPSGLRDFREGLADVLAQAAARAHAT